QRTDRARFPRGRQAPSPPRRPARPLRGNPPRRTARRIGRRDAAVAIRLRRSFEFQVRTVEPGSWNSLVGTTIAPLPFGVSSRAMSECDVEYVIMPNWCVAAVGADGHRVVLDRFVSRERAEELRQMLVSC